MPIHPRLQALLDAQPAAPAASAASVPSASSAAPVVVLDANAVLDLYYWRDAAAAPLAALIAQGRVRAVRSRACDLEIALVLSRPSLGAARSRRKTTNAADATEAPSDIERRAEALARWLAAAAPLAEAEVAEAAAALEATGIRCRDPEDQKVIALAAAAKAALLVTKDRLVLKAMKKAARVFGTVGAAPADVPVKLGLASEL